MQKNVKAFDVKNGPFCAQGEKKKTDKNRFCLGSLDFHVRFTDDLKTIFVKKDMCFFAMRLDKPYRNGVK